MFVPLTTPFHADGRLYLAKLEANVNRYARTPAAGMQVLSTMGEADALTDAEAVEVLHAAIGAAADEKVMLAEVGRPSVFRTLALAEAAAAAGYDAVTVRLPYHAAPVYLQVIADRSPLPVVLDGSDGVPAAVAGHPRVIGAIARSGSFAGAPGTWEVTVTNVFAAVTERMLRHSGDSVSGFVSAASLSGGVAAPVVAGTSLKTRTKKVGFQVLAGSLDGMLAAWRNGAAGAVPWLAPAIPQVCCEVWQAFRDGDPELAREKQERVSGVAAALGAVRSRVAAVKYGCDLNAYFGGRGRLPVVPLTGDERTVVETALTGIRN